MENVTLLKAQGEWKGVGQASVHRWDKHAVQEGQRKRGRMGVCNHWDKDFLGVEGW